MACEAVAFQEGNIWRGWWGQALIPDASLPPGAALGRGQALMPCCPGRHLQPACRRARLLVGAHTETTVQPCHLVVKVSEACSHWNVCKWTWQSIGFVRTKHKQCSAKEWIKFQFYMFCKRDQAVSRWHTGGWRWG